MHETATLTPLQPRLVDKPHDARPLVSVIVPMFNEGDQAATNLQTICEHMLELEREYRWELLVVNDGSSDSTAQIIDDFAERQPNTRTLHHMRNRGLGQSLRTGFAAARGDYVVTLDADLSYAPAHIDVMLEKIRATNASIVVASPYMDGGRASNIPWLRRTLSRNANRFLGLMANNRLSTLTGMVRLYDGAFLRSLNLRQMGADINPKIIHHARILNASIVEVPAHLCWPEERRTGTRVSYGKLARETLSVLISGFLMRPFLYFLAPGVVLAAMSVYANSWMLIHIAEQYQKLKASGVPFDFDDAVAAAFLHSPHVFIIGGLTLILAIQLIGMAVISLQTKFQFDELFFLSSSIYRGRPENGERV